jgi:hypothetical protein
VLVRKYSSRIRERIPEADNVEPEAIIETARHPAVCVILGWRGDRPIGFSISSPGEAGAGNPVYWISHFYCEGDFGVSLRLLNATLEEGRRHGYTVVMCQLAFPRMMSAAEAMGWKPVAQVYAREV